MPKKIIGGHKYDPQTATLIVTKWNNLPPTEDGEPQEGKYKESLYLKQNGQYFLLNENTATKEWEIIPLRNIKKARDWTIERFGVDKVEEIWGPIPE